MNLHLVPGNHTFEFSFELDHDSTPTFSKPTCCVEYIISALAERNSQSEAHNLLSTMSLFKVLEGNNKITKSTQQKLITSTKTITFENGETVSLDLNSQVSSNETLSILIKNLTSDDMFHFKIVEQIREKQNNATIHEEEISLEPERKEQFEDSFKIDLRIPKHFSKSWIPLSEKCLLVFAHFLVVGVKNKSSQ